MKVSFDESNPLELERAKRIIQDMIKRGYSLFVHGEGGKLIRVKRFDPKTNIYVIADGPSKELPPTALADQPKRGPGRPRKGEVAVLATKVKATVVGRSAGG